MKKASLLGCWRDCLKPSSMVACVMVVVECSFYLASSVMGVEKLWWHFLESVKRGPLKGGY
jgi:hypothetical protein